MHCYVKIGQIAALLMVLELPTAAPVRACIATPPPQPDVMIPMPRDLPRHLSIIAGTRITFALPHFESLRVKTTEGLAVRSKPGDGQLVIASDPHGGGQEAILQINYHSEKWASNIQLLRWTPPPTLPQVIDLTDGRTENGDTIGITARTELDIRVKSKEEKVEIQFSGKKWTPQHWSFNAEQEIFKGLYTLSGIDRSDDWRLEYGTEIEVTVRTIYGEGRLQKIRFRIMPTPLC